MSLLVKGVTKLSQLTIDGDGAGGDKDWGLTGIKSIKELALAMVQGDILVHDGVRIVRLPAGVTNLVLTSNGPLNIPSWQPGGLYLNRYFPASIYLTKALTVVVANHTVNRAAPITSAHVQTTGDLPGSYVKEFRPTITLPGTRTVVVANKTYTKSPATIGRQYDLQIVVQGAFRSPLGVDADETAAAQDLQPASRVGASAQDSSNSSGAYSNVQVEARFGNQGGAARNSAFKFTGISIPVGATITEARIWFTAKATRASQTVPVTIKGEAAAAPADYGAAEDFTARAYNATVVSANLPDASWTAEGQYATADIKTIVQALLTAYGPYVAGNMAFEVINNAASANNYQDAYSWDSDVAKAPILVIAYTKTGDMNLPPQTPLATDAYRFGHEKLWDVLRLNVGTAGVGVWAVTWKYWNGALVALAGVVDGTNGFHNAGINEVTFTRPGDWVAQNLGGLGAKYYITPDITAYTSRATQPLGTQAWVRIIT